VKHWKLKRQQQQGDCVEELANPDDWCDGMTLLVHLCAMEFVALWVVKVVELVSDCRGQSANVHDLLKW
jgi:hypothetical protein